MRSEKRDFLIERAQIFVLSLVVAFCGCGRSPEAESVITTESKRLKWTSLGEGLEATSLPDREEKTSLRFEPLPVDRTGIDFAHNWIPPADYKLEIYNSLPGGGICIGDYDGDDLPDVYLTQAHVGCKLYRNLGDFKFQDVTESTGLGTNNFGQGAAFVDIDNDGDLDLYVCNDEHPNRLYLNDGKGHFTENAAAAGLDFSGASVMPAIADYDQDGDLDIYLVTNRMEPQGEVAQPQREADGTYTIAEKDKEFVDVIVPTDGQPRVIRAAQYDHLFQNDGTGTFVDVSESAGLVGNYWGLSAIWWDYDDDGWLDLYVSNDFYSPDQLYRNNGDGTFTDVASQAFPHTPWYSMGTDVADINNDGRLELMGSDMSASNHYKQKASMGDMNTTGWFLTHPTPRQYMRNTLYLNTGTNRFMEIASLAGVANTDWTWSLKFADLDEDGWVDLFVTNGMNRDWTNSDLRNLTNQMESEDEKLKIWLNSPQRRDKNLAYRNRGDLRFQSIGDDWGLSDDVVSYGAALADLDRDGDLDLVVNHAEKAPGVYRNHTANSNRILVALRGVESNRMGVGAKITLQTEAGEQFRQLNTSQGYMSSNETIAHFGLSDNDSITRMTIDWPSGQKQVFEDLSANMFYRITEANNSVERSQPKKQPTLFTRKENLAGALHEETPFNDFARQPLLPMQLSQLGPGMAFGDIDGDDDVDIYLSGASGQSGQLFENLGHGEFRKRNSKLFERDSLCEDMAPLLFDADGDSDLDLYVVSGGVECEPNDESLQDRIYLNDGKGNYDVAPSGTLPEIRSSGSTVVTADFDQDGDLDLFVGGRVIPGQYPLTPRSYLLRNDKGQFVDATSAVEGLEHLGMVTAAIWSDADGDGWIDLLVALEWGPTRLFLNKEGRLVESTHESGMKQLTGWYNSISAADFDRDGDIDFLVGNVGLNTKYHASKEKPTLLYYGDFEKSGRMRLVEAEFEDETLFPVRGKSCSTNAMPFLGQKFGKFHDFAAASLQEIYPKSSLETAHRYAANSLESGVWKNDGTGKFEFLPLPPLAQASPIFGTLTIDANADGHLDVVAVQNFFGPQSETGRFDGGVGIVLLGKGDCTFRALPPHQSGFVVAGDATALCQSDMDNDGRMEMFVASNDGPVYVFEAKEAPPIDAFVTIRLMGASGNQQAIGSRLTGIYNDGSQQAIEVAAGGGYLSQSTPSLVFRQDGLKQIKVVWPDGMETLIENQERFNSQITLKHPTMK